MKKVLELDPSHYQAKKTIIRLEPLAAEKREKMKEEMIGKTQNNLLLIFSRGKYIKPPWFVGLTRRPPKLFYPTLNPLVLLPPFTLPRSV